MKYPMNADLRIAGDDAKHREARRQLDEHFGRFGEVFKALNAGIEATTPAALSRQADVITPNPPTQHDIAAECFAATDAAVALTARGRTWLALDTAAEVGLMQQSSLWQSGGASEDGFLLWAKARGIAVQFVAKDPERSGSVDVMRLDSDLVKCTFYFDGPVRK